MIMMIKNWVCKRLCENGTAPLQTCPLFLCSMQLGIMTTLRQSQIKNPPGLLSTGKVRNMTDHFNLTENLSNFILRITVSANNPMDKDTTSNIFVQNRSQDIISFLKHSLKYSLFQ